MILKRKLNILLVILFSLILIAPLFDNIFNISPVKNLFEKRIPVQIPQSPKTLEEVKKYPQNFDKFFNDNYGFRKTLISINSFVMDNIFDQSPSDRALIGRDEWLYFDNNNSLLDAQGLVKIDDKEIEIACNSFIKNWQNLKAQNIEYLLIIAADKTSIYPEFLPNFIKISAKNHRIDKFIVALKNKAPDFPIIDLRPILLEAKKNEIIYQKTDTHWNRRGAHYGYVEIMKKLNLKYHPRSDFTDVEEDDYIGDISNIMNIELSNIDYTLQEKFTKSFFPIDANSEQRKFFYKLEIFGNKNKNLPVLFVYKDSFFDNVMYFMAAHFSKSYFINEFPCDLDMNVIKKYNPNIVISQFWEGRIEEVINNCRK